MIIDFIIEFVKNTAFVILTLVVSVLLIGSFLAILYGIQIGNIWLSVIGGVVFISMFGLVVTIIYY